MTENEARQVLLLQAVETATASPTWTHEDRSWATRQAVATLGEGAAPERFVVARAVLALQRMLPRDAAARRWLDRRGWHPAWVLLAAVLGAIAGLVADQLGAPQRVNLLAPAVWAVVGWNLLVYVTLLLPLPALGLRSALARLGLRGDESAGALWASHAAPLMRDRAALVLHTAAAALALGLVAGLYLRGLVLDYRAGWQSTFADGAAVQQALDLLLGPARWLTGIAVPDVAPLRLTPGGDAAATAAPWIHLYAATLGLFVLLPRCVLATLAGWRAQRRSRHFPVPLDTPYFAALHPLMRPGLARVVRLLWVSQRPAVRLLGSEIGALDAPRALLRSDEGDELQLVPVPAELTAVVPQAASAGSWWSRWLQPGTRALPRLREQVDAVLLVRSPDTPRPHWLESLERPVLELVDGPTDEANQLNLRALADGWLADGRLLPALGALLPGDPRLPRLAQAWAATRRARMDSAVGELASTLARLACDREPVVEEGLLSGRRGGADVSRQALLARLDTELRAHGDRLAAILGVPAAPVDDKPVVTGSAALHARMGEGRAALMGGVVSGALAGLKADVLSGGLTMGAGAVAGGLLGALGAAGAARGLNVVRGTDHSFVAWGDDALAAIAEALLLRYLVLEHGLTPVAAAERLAPVLVAQQAALSTLWRTRSRRPDSNDELHALATALRPTLDHVLRQALGGPRA